MSVYVDPLFSHSGSDTFKWKESCHMYADTLEELHSMALKIGMKLSWFQNKESLQHYDLVASRRKLAIRYGAISHNRQQLVDFMRKIRDARQNPSLNT